MTGLELIVALGLAVFVGSVLATKLHIAAPLPLLLLGALLAMAPDFRNVHLEPSVVLFIFLPALLFWEALTSSLRSLRTYVRGVILTSTLLVVITAGSVAIVAHAFGLSWGSAWVLGAALAPTDATVVAAMSKLLPTRTLAVLRSESLLNDGTALVVFSVAVGIAMSEHELSALDIGLEFVISIVGGIGFGLLTGYVAYFVRRRLHNPLHDNAMLVLTPFVAYLLAELIHASGVLAVVTAGLFLTQVAPRAIGALPRRQSTGFWNVTSFLLNGALFVLVGVELPSVLNNLRTVRLGRAVGLGVTLLITLFVVRLAFLVVSAYLIRGIDRRPQQRDLRVSNRARVVSAVCGFRGAVSLAMALSVPAGLASRDLIVFATAAVVLGTIGIQGLALPAVVRWARLPHDDTLQREYHEADQQATQAALDALPDLSRELDIDPDVESRVYAELQGHLEAAEAADEDGHDAVESADRYYKLRLALVGVRRDTIVRLRDDQHIDDEVLLSLQTALDDEELRWSPG